MNTIETIGKINFDPRNITKKHLNQASWKYVAMVDVDGDVSEYYAWFIEKRYGLKLNKPLRGSHISFINDSNNDIRKNLGTNDYGVDLAWNNLKEKYNTEDVKIILDVDVRGDGRHWWLNLNNETKEYLQKIRSEIGLNKPYFGMHMSIGYANDKNLNHSNYILRTIKYHG